ncbi:MAG TPA: methyltransferase domain-containing protein [Dehalococcoidia bacterium]|nr:methyltransferase domain-containing protein [Dehalococcoidia bacterium]
MAASRYTAPIDLANLNESHSLGVLSVPEGAQVLDVGAADGSVASVLQARGCTVWAVEQDPAAAEAARRYCERVVQADVEAIDLRAEFAPLHFDAILFLDVLEHLREPERVLRSAVELLAGDGRIVASIPNVAHADLRLHLLQGAFRYRETGLLDRTHLRFFDKEAVQALFAGAGLEIIEDLRVTAPLGGTDLGVDPHAFAPEILQAATADPEAETFQFVVVARRKRRGRVTTERADLATLLQRRNRELERTARDGAGHVQALQGELAERGQRIEALQATLAEREARLQATEVAHARRVAELERCLTQRAAELDALNGAIEGLRNELAITEGRGTALHEELSAMTLRHEQQTAWASGLEAQLAAKNAHIRWLEALLQEQTALAAAAVQTARGAKPKIAGGIRRFPPVSRAAHWVHRKVRN